MEMYEYFEQLLNDVMVNENANDYMPSSWIIWSESYGWCVEDGNTGETLYIKLEV